jgi:hypothetical protein
MNNQRGSVDLPSLPPRLPQNEAELKRTIILLGNRKQVELKTEARRQLESLIGVYPTMKRLLYGSACYVEHAKGSF